MENSVKRYQKNSEELLAELQTAKENGTLQDTLLSIFMEHEVDMYAIWKVRQYIIGLPAEFYDRNPAFLTCLILIETMRGDLDRANELIARLGHTDDVIDPKKVSEIDLIRMMAELINPSLNNTEFLRRARFIASAIDTPILSLALNACRPSIINGFRDLTEFCPTMGKNKAAIERMTASLYGSNSRGIYEVALAEWKYETDSPFEALILVAGTIPALEDADDIRCLFVAFLLQMKILIGNGQDKASNEMFEKIRKIIENKGYEELQASLNAFIALQKCCDGSNADVEDWLRNTAPNENDEIFMMDMYPYLVKMRAYLQTGQYMLTLLLAKKMLEKLDPAIRPHDACECCLMSAMACYMAGNEAHALEDFEQALRIGQKYGYIRLFGDEGQMTLNLIRLLKSRKVSRDARELYIKKIRSAALERARRFPNYLISSKDDTALLTPAEQSILRLIAEGLSNDDIADRLGKKTGTIKFHTSGIYRKLNVESRQQAVNAAKEKGIL